MLFQSVAALASQSQDRRSVASDGPRHQQHQQPPQVSLPLTPSPCPCPFISLHLSLSLYPPPFIPLPLSLSLYPPPFIPSLYPLPLSPPFIPSLYPSPSSFISLPLLLFLSLCLYPPPFIPLPLFLSLFLYLSSSSFISLPLPVSPSPSLSPYISINSIEYLIHDICSSYIVFNIAPTIVDIVIAVVYFLTQFNAWFAFIVFVTMVLYLGECRPVTKAQYLSVVICTKLSMSAIWVKIRFLPIH